MVIAILFSQKIIYLAVIVSFMLGWTYVDLGESVSQILIIIFTFFWV